MLLSSFGAKAMKTTVVNVFKEHCDVYGGRPSMLGNPYKMINDSNLERERVIRDYKIWFEEKLKDPQFKAYVDSLKGLRLGCFCSPKRCHLEVVVAYLESNNG